MSEKQECEKAGDMIADLAQRLKRAPTSPFGEPVGRCNIHQYVFRKQSDGSGVCPECERIYRAAQQAIPPRYRNAEMSPSLRERLIACLSTGTGPHVITLAGPPDVGKTWNACGLWRHCVEQEIKVKFWLVSDLMIYLAGLWREQERNPYDNIEGLEKFDGLLILDDLGKEKLTESAAQNLFAILNNRIMWDRPTLITTNLPWQAKAGVDSVESVYGKSWLWRLEPGYVPVTERKT